MFSSESLSCGGSRAGKLPTFPSIFAAINIIVVIVLGITLFGNIIIVYRLAFTALFTTDALALAISAAHQIMPVSEECQIHPQGCSCHPAQDHILGAENRSHWRAEPPTKEPFPSTKTASAIVHEAVTPQKLGYEARQRHVAHDTVLAEHCAPHLCHSFVGVALQASKAHTSADPGISEGCWQFVACFTLHC